MLDEQTLQDHDAALRGDRTDWTTLLPVACLICFPVGLIAVVVAAALGLL